MVFLNSQNEFLTTRLHPKSVFRVIERTALLGELSFKRQMPLNEVLEMNELDREGAHDFTHPSSEFYPKFSAAIRAKINEWCPAQDLEEFYENEI